MHRKDPILPRGIQRLLRLFLRADLVDEVTGDLHEMYKDTRTSHSRFASAVILWYQTLNYIRPFAIRKGKQRNSINSLPMYKSYFIAALRNMTKNKMHATLNILGLSVGITVTMMITLWIADELSHEKNFKNYDRIGKVVQNITNNGHVQTWFNVPYPLADELRKNYGTDFERIAVSRHFWETPLKVDSTTFVRNGMFAESDLAKMLDLKMIYGTIDAVDDPSLLLISKSTSIALFGDRDPIGRQLQVDETFDVTIGGVYEDIPQNSEFTSLQFLGSWKLFSEKVSWMKGMDDPWRPNAFFVYVQLTDNATFEGASARIKDVKMRMVNEALKKKKPELFLLPMKDWHLRSEFVDGKQTNGRMQYVWLFGIVGAFVLLMACINFMNLSTARSEKRAKEVGIRKAIGSLRSQLIKQFLSESVLTVFISLLIALLVAQVSLPFFNLISEKNMSLPWANPSVWLVCISFMLIIGLIAGSYPALYLSSMGLNQVTRNGRSSTILRKALVTVQFTVSVILIIGTAVVYLQIQYARNRPLGYNVSGIITVPSVPELHHHVDAIREELQGKGAIVNIAESMGRPTENFSSTSQVEWKGKDPNLSIDFPYHLVSHDYGKTIQWNLLKGRDFEKERVSDSTVLIINKAAAEMMGFNDPVGEMIRWAGHPFEVIGMVDNIVSGSPYDEPIPMMYVAYNEVGNHLVMRLNPDKPVQESLSAIEPVYNKYNPGHGFDFEFTDVAYSRKFGNEERVGTLATTFAFLAIFISCLGIFGLSSFTAEQRTKEIGVRKVLGASVFNLWTMMSKDFVALAVISCVIAMPIAYWLLNDWLENFAYHMGIPIWTFLAATIATILITLITVSWHTLTAAGSNPVKSLRTE